LNYSNAVTIIVKKVPAQLRQADLTQVLPELLQQVVHIEQNASSAEIRPLCHWLAMQGSQGFTAFSWEQATQIYTQFSELEIAVQQQVRTQLFKPLDHMSVIERFKHDSTAK